MNALSCPPGPSEGNRHHNLPRSQGGSSDKGSNITVFDEREHTAFHSFAGHPSPCGFMRLLLARSLSVEARTMSPGAAADLFELLTPDDWRRLYREEALRIVDGKPEHEKYLALASYHIACQVQDETAALLNAYGAIGLSQYAPVASQTYVAQGAHHFGVGDAPAALDAFVRAENARGELKYARPFTHAVRSDILAVLRHAKPEQLDDRDRAQMLRVVEEQRRRLAGRSSKWKPGLATLIDLREHEATQPAAAPRIIRVA